MREAWVLLFGLSGWLLVCCTGEYGDDDGRPTLPDDDDLVGDDDDDDSQSDDDDDDTVPDPQWSCAPGLTMAFDPLPVDTDDVLNLHVTGDTGYTYVGMDGSDPHGTPADPTWNGVTGDGPWTWSYYLGGLIEGRYDFVFTADSGATWLCDAAVWVGSGHAGGDDDDDDDDSTPSDDDDDTGGPPDNPFGIGLVGPGNSDQWDRAAELSGRGGHVKLIFPGIELGMGGPPQDWVDACNEVYARDLVPVIRMQTGWGQSNVRNLSDDGSHMSYTSLAASFAAVVAGLPKRDGWPMVIEVFNEPNLCYEWTCDAGEGWLGYETTAAEYASLLRDVTDALHALGDSRVKVINAGLAPGGTVSCECGGAGWTGGITSREFLTAMEAAVPGVHAQLDGFATHAYPAEGEGWGFFEEYGICQPGIYYFETELDTLGISKPVYITETGWSVDYAAAGDRNLVADWTLQVWQNDWFGHPDIEAVLPFMLQDSAWDAFAWITTSNTEYPVFATIRDWRCSMDFPDPC
jgi:hypothetical protein